MLDTVLSFSCDLYRGIDRTPVRPVLMTGDKKAHTFQIAVSRFGSDVDLASSSVSAYFVRADGVTVPITGSVSGSTASVTLPDSCYNVPGRFQLVIKMAMDGEISTILWADGAVAASSTDAILDDEHVIPSLDDLLAQIATTEAATANANSAASSANTAATRADNAASAIENISAKATTLSPGSQATADVETVDGIKVINIGVPKGDKGDKGEPGKDGSGSVSSVNGIASVAGNVTLTAADVGALPDTYTPPVTSVDGKTGDVTVDMLGAYPVGSIYMSVGETSPASLFGGTWERIEDRFLLASGSSWSAGTEGGEAEHTLTVDEMPAHSHAGIYWGNNTLPSREISHDSGTSCRQVTSTGNAGSITSNRYVTGDAGGGAAHNNMPPYLAVNVWKRVA